MLKLLITIIASSLLLTACLGLVPPSRDYKDSKSNIKILKRDALNIDTIK